MEAEEELLKETVRAFKAGLHGEEYDNPFTAADEAAEHSANHPTHTRPHPPEDGTPA